MARKNIAHYIKAPIRSKLDTSAINLEDTLMSFEAGRGSVSAPAVHSSNPDGTFPKNVLFFSGDFCPKNDVQVNEQEPEYDTILALSLVKWVHINNRDEGLIRFFQRCYRALRKDGYFILEPQDWASYKKKKRQLPVRCQENLKSIKIQPDEFEKILTEKIGFKLVEITHPKPVETDDKIKNGFGRRPLMIFKK